MFKLLRKINRALNKLVFAATPKVCNPADCFAFKDDEEKRETYDECLELKRHLRARNPLLKLYLIFWMGAVLWLIGTIIYNLYLK